MKIKLLYALDFVEILNLLRDHPSGLTLKDVQKNFPGKGKAWTRNRLNMLIAQAKVVSVINGSTPIYFVKSIPEWWPHEKGAGF